MKKILMVTCTSFTTVVLLFAFLSQFGMTPGVTGAVVLQLFFMSLTIGVAMLLLDKVMEWRDISSLLLDVVVRVLICYFVVLAEGCFFGMLKPTLQDVLQISPVLIPAIAVTYGMSLLSLMESASCINRTISRKRDKKIEEL